MRGAARADDWSLHLIGVAQLGYTDNLLSAPRTPPADAPDLHPQWDLYLSAQPGVLVSYGTPRTTHELTYTLDGTLYTRHSELSTLLQRVGYRGFFLVSPRSELVAAANGSFGNANLFPDAVASAGTVVAQRSGTLETRGADADEDYSYLLAPDLRVSQGLFGRYQWTDNGMGTTTADEVGARLVLSKSFRADSLTASTSASYLSLTRPLGAAGPAGDDQITIHGTLGWNHDINREWTFAADGGAVGVLPQSGTGKSQLLPVASATIAYYPTWGSARLVVRREVAPNLLIAQNTLTETAVATGWLPLPWLRDDPTNPTLSVQTTAGVARTRLIDDAAGDTIAAYDDLIGDVALNWSPRKSVNVALRYQLIWQSTASDQAADAITIRGFIRNTVLLQFYGRWPERLAADVPVRQTLRVDRSNLTPLDDQGQSDGGGSGGGR